MAPYSHTCNQPRTPRIKMRAASPAATGTIQWHSNQQQQQHACASHQFSFLMPGASPVPEGCAAAAGAAAPSLCGKNVFSWSANTCSTIMQGTQAVSNLHPPSSRPWLCTQGMHFICVKSCEHSFTIRLVQTLSHYYSSTQEHQLNPHTSARSLLMTTRRPLHRLHDAAWQLESTSSDMQIERACSAAGVVVLGM